MHSSTRFQRHDTFLSFLGRNALVLACAFAIAVVIYLVRTSVPRTLSANVVHVADHSYQVQIARTDEERERGLMGRTSLLPNHGMLFVFDTAQPLAFWMKDTLIPLDILFFDENLRLVNTVADAKSCTTSVCADYWSTTPARYVLELPGGTAQHDGIRPGTTLRIDPKR